MSISAFGMENFRVFDQYTEFEIRPITILTGPNNSGKSSLMKTMKLLKYSYDFKYYSSKIRDASLYLIQPYNLNFIDEKIGLINFERIKSDYSNKDTITFTFTIPFLLNDSLALYDINYKPFYIKVILTYKSNNGANYIGELYSFDLNFIIEDESLIKLKKSKILKSQNLFELWLNIADFLLIKYNKIRDWSYYFGGFRHYTFNHLKIKEISKELNFDVIRELCSLPNVFSLFTICNFYIKNMQITPWLLEKKEVYDFNCYEQIENFLANIKLNKEKKELLLLKLRDVYKNPKLTEQFNKTLKFLSQFYEEFLSNIITELKTKLKKVYFINFYEKIDLKYDILTSLHNLDELYIDFMKQWLQKFELTNSINIHEQINSFLLKIGSKYLQEYGSGTSHFIVLLLNILYFHQQSDDRVSGNYKLFYIEEPETNLHPKLQSLLADFFYDAKNLKNPHFLTSNTNFIIETHSEYLIRKFQVMVAKGEADSKDIIIYYIDPPKDGHGARARKIEIDKNGFLSDDFGEGFFDESANLISQLWKTQNWN